MIRFLAAVAVVLTAAFHSLAEPTGKPFCISTEGSERATTGPGNMIVTAAGKTHIVWQDSTKDGYFNRARTLDRASGQWSAASTLNRGKDNHARPILTIDSSGTLHAVISGHNSPVIHRQSKRPHDTSEWTDPVEIGAGTYPVMACGGDDTLYLTLRSAKHDALLLYIKPPGKSWQKPVELVRRAPEYTGYVGYANGLAFGPDGKILHIVCDFYEGKDWDKQLGLHQAVTYMRSPDGGRTWQRADGSDVAIPARPETMDTLAQDIRVRPEKSSPPVLSSGGAILVDSKGSPFIFYSSHLKKPGELILASTDARGQWRPRSVDAIEKSHAGFRINRRSFTIMQDDVIEGIVELAPIDDAKLKDGFPTRESRLNPPTGTPVVWMISRDGGETFEVTPALPTAPQVARCAFNIERPGGHNRIEMGRRPSFSFFEGLIRYPEKDETIQNKVYWFEARSDGEKR